MPHALRRPLLFLLAFVFLIAAPVQAQNSDELGGALSSIGQTYADSYTQPITDALGADLTRASSELLRWAGKEFSP
jgi:hypothetical protein